MSKLSSLQHLRRALHRIPELGFEEHRTRALVVDALHGLGVQRRIARTGLVVDLGPSDARSTLLLRADMDALPIEEENDQDYASTHPGRMHACGHDAHMAALVGAAPLLEEALPEGLRLRLLFQPAEEGAGGAALAISEGALDGVDAAFGIHVWNELPLGTVAVTPGGIMAGVVEVRFKLQGRGGHGALPDRARDPILAGAQLVTALQSVASRLTSPFEPVVVTLASFHSGDAFNVIPESAELTGTVRTFSRESEASVEAQMAEIVRGVATSSGVKIEMEWRRYAGPTVNDDEIARQLAAIAADVKGIDRVLTDYRTMAGEDFGDILEAVPGCFVLLGSGPADGSRAEPHHSPRFDIEEGVLEIARDLHLAVAAGLRVR